MRHLIIFLLAGSLLAQTSSRATFEKSGQYLKIRPGFGVWWAKQDTTWGGASGPVYWTNILNKPSTYPPDAHAQAIGTITGLPDSIADKVAVARFTADSSFQRARAIADSQRLNDSCAGKQSTSAKGVANGYAGLGATSLVPAAQLGTGSASGTTYLRGDQTWATPSGGGASVEDSTFCLNEWWIQKNLGALTTIANVGFATAPTARGTATAFQDTFGSFLNYATAAVLDSPGGWRSNIYTEFQLRQAPQLTAIIKTGAAATDTNKCVYWIGFLGGNYKRLGDSATWNIAAFRYATALDSTLKTWQFVTKAGGAAGVNTVTNTGIAIAPSRVYKITVKAFPNAANTAIDSVQACINGARVACHTTTIPAPATNLGFYAMITAKITVAHNLRISKIYGKQR